MVTRWGLIFLALLSAMMFVMACGPDRGKDDQPASRQKAEDLGYTVNVALGADQQTFRVRRGETISIPAPSAKRFLITDSDGATHTVSYAIKKDLAARRIVLTDRGIIAGQKTFAAASGDTLAITASRSVRTVLTAAQLQRGVMRTGVDVTGRLTQRLAALQPYQHGEWAVRGTDSRGEVRLTRDWMLAFWPGALWQAYAAPSNVKNRQLLGEWALSATRIAQRHARDDNHDVGFMLMRSAAAGYDQLCLKPNAAADEACAHLGDSAVAAADNMLRMIASNPGGRTAPTRTVGCKRQCTPGQADTIIDSMPNITLLGWAAKVTGQQKYRTAARAHADRVMKLLIRPDYSTWQSAHTDRRTGKVVLRHTHQGLSDRSTWARGQAWAIYGYARLGEQLGSQKYMNVSRRLAGYWLAHTPKNQVPRYDLDATSGPRDSSAAAVAAAGMAILARNGKLPARTARHAADIAAGAVGSTLYDFGVMGKQTYTYGESDWDENAEFMMGVDFLLEAVNLLAR